MTQGSLAADRPLDYPALARKIVERLAPQPGERVVSLCHPEQFTELRAPLARELERAGAVDLGCIDVLADPSPAVWGVEVPAGATPLEVYRAMLEKVDAGLALPGAVPSHPAYAALQDLMRREPKRMIHFHWDGAGGSAIAVPGGKPPSREAMDRLYQTAVLETDYAALASLQRRFEAALREGTVRVTTPAGTDIRFRIDDRPVTRQDGDASAGRARQGRVLIDREVELPPGAVRVAPVETGVSGTIVFPPAEWNKRPVSAVTMRFDEGRIVGYAAESGEDAVREELERVPVEGRYFREFALGLNPLLAVPAEEPWIPYYGYGAGVVRLSLGDNSELGGNVGGGWLRWNFFTDATVTVGETTWVERGKLVAPPAGN